MRLVLASASPRRVTLLKAAGFTFDVVPVDIDESARPGEQPSDYVRRLAMEKSQRALVLRNDPAVVVVAADTTVVVEGLALGKPADDDEARRMLARLSGRYHLVLTGLSVRRTRQEAGSVESTKVWFSALGQAEIEWYVRSGEGRDKAGGYAIQGLASRFVPRIEGSYSNVVGLPVAALHALLPSFQVSPFG